MNVYVNSNFYFVDQVFISHVSPPHPLSQLLSINPLITSTAPPLPHTKFRRSGSCECGQTGSHLAVIPVRFPYKQPRFTVSLVVPVEFWKSTNPFPPVLAAHTVIFLLYYSIEVSSFRFSITLSFLTIVDFLQCN